MWHVVEGVNILSKFQLPSSYGLGVMMFKGLEEKDDRLNQLITKVFVNTIF